MTSARRKALHRYKAFISYSHGADNRLAPALRTALHGFAKPWYRLRAMRVFRDETGLAITPALWPSIEAALLDSEDFLLLASPDAAASEWVQREVACWLDRRPADHLLIALTRGEIRWNDAVHDFDWNGTDALPHQESVRFATFSPDGTRVLTATDFTAQLWDATGTAGKVEFVWTPGAQIYHATFSPDGAYALTAGEDHRARLWDVKTGKETAALPHPDSLSPIRWSMTEQCVCCRCLGRNW